MNSGRCSALRKPRAYIQLLNFSRISRQPDPNGEGEDDETIIGVLNTLPASDLPVRPLLPLIYRNAIETGVYKKLDPEAKKFLKHQTLILVGQELQNRRYLNTIIASFNTARIPIILLKGAAFAGHLYPADAPRPGIDIDFLVKRHDFTRACKIMSKFFSAVISSDKRMATHHTLFERIFIPKESPTPVIELHRDLTNPYIFTIGEEHLWADSEPHPQYESEGVRILSPEHALLHLAVHAFRDLDYCSHNLLDVHELVGQCRISTEKVYRDASRWHAKATLFHLLKNTESIMGTQIDENLLSKLEPSSLTKGLQNRILNSPLLGSEKRATGFRAIQLASQLSIPDSMYCAIKFQIHYMATRFHDWIFSWRQISGGVHTTQRPVPK